MHLNSVWLNPAVFTTVCDGQAEKLLLNVCISDDVNDIHCRGKLERNVDQSKNENASLSVLLL